MFARWACVALLGGVASCADIRLGAQLNADIPELTLAAAQVSHTAPCVSCDSPFC